MMIGILALAVALLLFILTILSAPYDDGKKDAPDRTETNYNNIYAALAPQEI